jgi:hypothetical protein
LAGLELAVLGPQAHAAAPLPVPAAQGLIGRIEGFRRLAIDGRLSGLHRHDIARDADVVAFHAGDIGQLRVGWIQPLFTTEETDLVARKAAENDAVVVGLRQVAGNEAVGEADVDLTAQGRREIDSGIIEGQQGLGGRQGRRGGSQEQEWGIALHAPSSCQTSRGLAIGKAGSRL